MRWTDGNRPLSIMHCIEINIISAIGQPSRLISVILDNLNIRKANLPAHTRTVCLAIPRTNPIRHPTTGLSDRPPSHGVIARQYKLRSSLPLQQNSPSGRAPLSPTGSRCRKLCARRGPIGSATTPPTRQPQRRQSQNDCRPRRWSQPRPQLRKTAPKRRQASCMRAAAPAPRAPKSSSLAAKWHCRTRRARAPPPPPAKVLPRPGV
mmetsp:Transcript_147290/g.470847  ORF Transcript_147290/g.470847 Transcript_147290/m.470847 type:complete len:207 (+) Transcript_147290:117-737(+)